MLVAAGSNYPAQLSLTKMLYELVGNFNTYAGKMTKKIIIDLQFGGRKFKPLKRLNPRL